MNTATIDNQYNVPTVNNISSAVNFDYIPDELKKYNQWILWKYGPDGQKLPLATSNPNKSIDYTNPKYWSSFDNVRDAYEKNSNKLSGIGFVFTESDPFVGIDCDKVRDSSSGYWEPEALQEIISLNTYAEISPSGTGAHAIIKGKRDPEGKNRGNNREIYDRGRYFTFTGNIIYGVPNTINEDNGGLKVIQDKIGYRNQSSKVQSEAPLELEDEELITKASSNPKFRDLFSFGNLTNYGNDDSRADMALCCILSFYTKDEAQIDRIFRGSKLYREKWNRTEYSETTIQKAIEFVKSGQSWEGYDVPKGYKINAHGLFRVASDSGKDMLICRTPVVISGIGEDIDRDEFWYRITFKDSNGRIKHIDAKHDQLMKRSSVIEICNKGILAADQKASDLCTYFSEAIFHLAKDLPRITFVQNNGWKHDNKVFVAGDRLYTADGISQAVQIKSRETAGLAARGSLDQWIDGVKNVIGYRDIRFKCYCVCSSMLLRLLGIDSFFLDHSANTTVGKSFGTKIAFSMIGDAKSLKLSGDSTETYLEERAALFNDLPLFLDETSTVDDINLRRIIYKISNEKGKGRGKKDGGVRELIEWKTVVLSTGEKSIVDHDGFSGQEVRVIEIHDEMPFIPDEVERATSAIENNCGHIIGLYMQKVFANKENLRLRLDVHRKKFMDDESRVVNRLASTFAVIAVAGELLEAVFEEIGIKTVDSTALVEQMFDETVRSRPVEPYAVKALRGLRDWTESSKSSFVVNDDLGSVKGYKKLGWICGSGFIDIIPSEAKAAMKQHGYDFSTARDEWIKMGVVEINEGRKDYKATHIDENGTKDRVAVCRINIAKMNEILGE
jgi:uncharacterized protein (DUF927 family)